MPSFIIRDIDANVWIKVRAQADKEGRKLRAVLLRLLALYAAKGLDALEKK